MAKKKTGGRSTSRTPKSEYAVYMYEHVREQELDDLILDIKEESSMEYFKHDALPERSGRTYTVVAIFRANA